jgi:hypothetical protein
MVLSGTNDLIRSLMSLKTSVVASAMESLAALREVPAKLSPGGSRFMPKVEISSAASGAS